MNGESTCKKKDGCIIIHGMTREYPPRLYTRMNFTLGEAHKDILNALLVRRIRLHGTGSRSEIVREAIEAFARDEGLDLEEGGKRERTRKKH